MKDDSHTSSPWRAMLGQFLLKRWFLLALVALFAGGLVGWQSLKELADLRWFRNVVVATVMFLMAFPLSAGAMGRALRRPGPPLLAVAINFGLLPLIAWGVSLLLDRDMGLGLLVAATTPCTLASASVWTRKAGGNDAVAILVTLITNLSCFIVTPAWLALMAGQAASSDALDVGAMIVKLGLLVLLPMALAQLLRLNSQLAGWATAHKLSLSVGAQIGILIMVLMGAVQMGARLNEGGNRLTAVSAAAALLAVCGVHLAAFVAGLQAGRLFGMERGDRIAVAISGSQKTLMVGLKVAMDLGFSILPMVSYHICQLLIDTVLADWLRKQAPPEEPESTK